MENRGSVGGGEVAGAQGERRATLAAAEPDLTTSSSEHLAQPAGSASTVTAKKSTKSRLTQPFKTLREVSRSASLKLRRTTGGGKDSNPDDEMSQGAEYNSSSAGSTLEQPRSKNKKSKDKKKKNESEEGGVEHLPIPDNTDETDDGKKKGKKKKGSSLVRKFSSKYRSGKSSGGEDASPQAVRHGESVPTSEMSAGDYSEDSQSLASSSTFASAGARTPDQSPSHPLPSIPLSEEEVELPWCAASDQVIVTSHAEQKRPSPTPPPRKQQKIEDDEAVQQNRQDSSVHVLPPSSDSNILLAPTLVAMATKVNSPPIVKSEEEEDISVTGGENQPPPPPPVMEAPASNLQDELNAAAAANTADEGEPTKETPKASAGGDVEASEPANGSVNKEQAAVTEVVREIVFPATLEDTTRVEDVPVAGSSKEKNGATAQGGERREHLYKILVIGELGTGKTSIIKRYVHQFFSQHYRATIGVDFALKVLTWDQSTIIRLQLWDIAGQERFGNMTRVYYKEAVGAFIVFDVTRTATFDAVLKWKADLDSKVQLPDGSPIPCVLLANKCDQQKEGVVNQPARMDEYCKEHGFSGWYETSAKENINIDEAARFLVTKILSNDKLANHAVAKDGDGFALDGSAKDDKGAQKSCAC